MDGPRNPGTSWLERVSHALKRWIGRWRREAPTLSLSLAPPCSACGIPSAHVWLHQDAGGWRLVFHGIAGGNAGGDRISDEKAQAIRDALSQPYQLAKIQAAGFYDDFGYCASCEKFYCSTHWQVSISGAGTCPAGHFKSLDPHWHPDWDDL